MMNFWTLDNLKSILGGTWLARPAPEERTELQGLSTDTRTLKGGEAFLALRGERFDGHDYLEIAGSAGAALAIVERAPAANVLAALPRGMSVLLVQDTGAALLKLAGAYRKFLEPTKFIAVGGSNGKTTTTRLIHAVLSKSLRGTASIKSYNNAVGVPLTILSAKKGDQYVLCEVGTNAPGELATLAHVVQPDVAVITSIGREHLEGFGGIEGVVREEASLLDDLRPGGLAVVTADSQELSERLAQSPLAGRTVIRFGFAQDADLRITSCEAGPMGTRFSVNGRSTVEIPLLGRHNACNATAALAVARRMGLDAGESEKALASAKGPEMRLEIVRVELHESVGRASRPSPDSASDSITFLNDAYNANPDSMLAALAVFDEAFPPVAVPGRRVLVLGDMLELGDAAPESHREIGQAVSKLRQIDLVILVGPLMTYAADRTRLPAGALMVAGEPTRETIETIAASLRPGDRVLLKGSRRMGLERVIPALRARMGEPMSEPKPATSARGRV